MSSAQVDRPTKVGHVNKKESDKSRKVFNASHKKHKHEDSRHFKFGRKRLQSFTSNGKFFPPYKRRKKEGVIIPPTKFLLGGNICDPLNLNSMQDEEINRAMNAVTPKSSPLPTPKHKKEVIEVIIPPNICDPLNLSNCNDNDEYEKQLISPTKKGSKRRNRKKKRASSGSGKDDASDSAETKQKEDETIVITESIEQSVPEKVEVEPQTLPSNSPPRAQPKETKPESPQKDKNKLRLKGLEEPKDKRLRKVDVKDKIVSPVIPQPGAWKPRLQHRPSQDKKKKQSMPNFREKDARYQYGNYNRYYGYRNPHHELDPRLTVFGQRKEMFCGKDVLDIGCNIGHITLSVARDLSARSVTGIDIDRTLINIARKNIKHYVNCVQSPASNEDNDHQESDANFFPMSMPINYGPVNIPGFTKNKNQKGFPYNVTFVQGNYVLEDDALLCSEQPQFDCILCLSITKWIHLNFGDAGLKQAFKRMHAQLRPGGVLVLEPQGWSSYARKKNLTERIYKTYQNIQFRPHKFTQYLLSPEVGFDKCEVVSIPPHPAKGFQRPIYLFTKGGCPENPDDSTENTSKRHERRNQKRMDMERREYERELFRKDGTKEGNISEISQQSSESMSQYEQLENVYAPSATPCYDTPGHNNDSQTPDASKMCYVDVNMETDKMEVEAQDSTEKQVAGKTEISQKSDEPSTIRKRILDTSDRDGVEDAKKCRRSEETISQEKEKKGKPDEVKKKHEETKQRTMEESKSKTVELNGRDESNARLTEDLSTKKTSVDSEKKSIDEKLKNSKEIEDKQGLTTEEQKHQKNGSRSLDSMEEIETKPCELTSDNT